jgi:hypothetical protein
VSVPPRRTIGPSPSTVQEFGLYNRSDRTLAILPGLSVPPCSERIFRLEELAGPASSLKPGDSSWVPDGDVLFPLVEAFAGDVSVPLPFYVVVSGSQPLRFDLAPPVANRWRRAGESLA